MCVALEILSLSLSLCEKGRKKIRFENKREVRGNTIGGPKWSSVFPDLKVSV